MTPEQFVYWLQGFIEIDDAEELNISPRQAQIIKDHLKEVFTKKTPNRSQLEQIKDISNKNNKINTPFIFAPTYTKPNGVWDDLDSKFIC